MARLPRPHIPLATRVQVAERQIAEAGITPSRFLQYMPLGARLRFLLEDLFGDKKAELHHRPALVNRRRKRNGKYDPDANDSAHLVYLEEGDHDVETRVRGQHGAHSDLGLARKNKRIAANRSDEPSRSRPLRSASRWPPRGSRKIGQ